MTIAQDTGNDSAILQDEIIVDVPESADTPVSEEAKVSEITEPLPMSEWELHEKHSQISSYPKTHSGSSGKRVLLMFTGGLDSTYLLRKLLSEGNMVDLLYVTGVACSKKHENELIARQQIIDTFKADESLPGRIVAEQIANLRQYSMDNDNVGMAFQQVLPWFYSLMKHVNPEKHKYAAMGYVNGDSVAYWLPKVEIAWRELMQVVYPIEDANDPILKLALPLMTTTKRTIIKSLGRDLLSKIWVCELPISVTSDDAPKYKSACDQCPACLRHNELFKTAFGYSIEDYFEQANAGDPVGVLEKTLEK